MKKKLFAFILISLIFAPIFASWDGLYRWDNNTNKSNWGKIKEITIRVKSVNEDYLYELYLIGQDGSEHRIFPLVLPSSPSYKEWHDYNEDSSEGEAFRFNNKRMNTTIVAPGKWKIKDSSVEGDKINTSIIASAFGMEITIEIEYLFSLDEGGNKQLTFGMDADQNIAKGKFFQNPEKGSDGKFTLSLIEEDAL